jgi:DNA-directed RNA polymerase specialized sigma24 family protein
LRPSDAELNDPRLVRAVQAGDGAAISRAIELCIPLLRTVVCGRLGLSAEECEDILQEVRIAFLEAGPRFRAHCSLRTYLVRITCRLCAAHLRARGRHGPEPRPLEEARGSAVLDLFYVQGKSYKEIAAEMGIAIGTVARMKSDALAKLRRAI